MDSSVDLEGDGNGYSGTFRWKASKKLNSLPATMKNRKGLEYTNWMKYFVSRSASDSEAGSLIQMVQSDLSIIDCLSTPMSICYLFSNTVFKTTPKVFFKKLSIVCLGCSSKAEERVLRETNCFLELCYYFYNVQHIDLWLVGPEMSATTENFSTQKNIVKNQMFTCSLFQGTSMQFFRSFPAYLNKSTVVVGFNCGFGNYENNTSIRYNLLLNWLPDLYFLTGTSLPLLFTCANDYADLNGEIRVMLNVLGANLILAPGENPFSYASTLVPPSSSSGGSSSGGEFSRGNSFCYAVQGHDKSRRHKVAFSEGLKCIPQFLSLFRSPLPPLSAVSCTLELEQIVKSSAPVPSTSAATTSTSTCPAAVPAVETSESTATPAVSSASMEAATVAVSSMSLSDAKLEASREAPKSDPPVVVDKQTGGETADIPQVPTESSISANSDHPSGCTKAAAAAAASLYTVNQSVVDHRLTVTIALTSNSIAGDGVVDLTQADLRISEDGQLLHFSLPQSNSSDSNAGAAKVDVIRLTAVVDHSSMRAKYSKRLLSLSITAELKK